MSMKRSLFLKEGVTTIRCLEKVPLILIILVLLVGCAFTPIQTYTVIDYNSIPKGTYTIFFYSFDQLRVAFLKNPESDVEVFPYSDQIIKTRGTPEDAMAFMKRGIYRNIDVKSVVFKDKTIGYLYTYEERGVTAGPSYLEADLFERNQKIYFDVTIKNYGTGAGGGNLSLRMSK